MHGASEISPGQICITGGRRSRACEVEAREQIRENIDRKTRSPIHYWIEAPSSRQSLWQRRQVVIERHCPATAQNDTMPHIEVRRAEKLAGIVEGYLRVSILKA